MGKVCRYCGLDNDDTATTCRSCGTVLPPPAWSQVVPPPVPPPPPAPPPAAVEWRPPPPPPYTDLVPRKRRSKWIAPVAVLALVGAGAGVWALTQRGDDGPSFPAQWDPRVADLVDFVEDERGLDFKHPVEVEFLTDAAFRERVQSADQELTAEEREEIDHAGEFFRSLGLAEGELDLLELFNQLSGETILAFYDLEEQRIIVRGTTLDVDRKVTLVHEMTHALQDQHFDLSEVRAAGDEYSSSAPDALIEGDAKEVERAYVEELSSADRREHETAQDDFRDDLEVDEVPLVMQISQSAPYDFGPVLVQLLKAEGGTDRLDAAFRDPPDAEEYFVDGVAYLEEDARADVAVPDIPDGATVLLDGGEFGVLGWYLMLSERIDPHDALHAIDGWDGDNYVAYRDNDRTCTRVTFEAESGTAGDLMRDAVETWIGEFGAADPRIFDATSTGFTLETCDPGPESEHVTDRIEETYVLPIARAQFVAALVDASGAGLDPSNARCVARSIIDDVTFTELTDPEGAYFQTDEYQRKLLSFLRDCT